MTPRPKRQPAHPDTLRLPTTLKRQLEERASREGVSLNALIVRVLREHGVRKVMPPEVRGALRKLEPTLRRRNHAIRTLDDRTRNEAADKAAVEVAAKAAREAGEQAAAEAYEEAYSEVFEEAMKEALEAAAEHAREAAKEATQEAYREAYRKTWWKSYQETLRDLDGI